MATVKLNVGGTHIEVAIDTLNKCEYFRAMLNGNFRDAAGGGSPVFLDCDLDKFTRGVLDPLRYNINIPADCVKVADFYGITTGHAQKHSPNDLDKLHEYLASFSILYETLAHRYLTPGSALPNSKKYIDLPRIQNREGLIHHQFKLDDISSEVDIIREEIKCDAYKYKNILSVKLALQQDVPPLSFTKKDIDNINTYYYLLYNNLAKDDYVSNKNILLLTYTEHYKKLINILEKNFAVLNA